MIEFTIPAVPPSLNAWSRKHWSVRRREAEKWKLLVQHHSYGLIPWMKPPKHLVVTLEFRLPRGGDADNRAKFVLDGLVHAEVIADDGPPYLYELRLRSVRGKPAETRVMVERAI